MVHYVNGNPSIILSKFVDQDVFSAPGTATYTYTVTNTGNVTLTGVTLVDDQEGGITLGATTLAPGQSTTGSSIHTVSQADMDGGDLVNIAVATGTPPVDDNVSDDDTQTVTTPDSSSIKVVKTAQALADTNGDGAAGAEGDVVTYDYTVTNTGNVTLDPVTLVDDVEGPVNLAATDWRRVSRPPALSATPSRQLTSPRVRSPTSVWARVASQRTSGH